MYECAHDCTSICWECFCILLFSYNEINIHLAGKMPLLSHLQIFLFQRYYCIKYVCTCMPISEMPLGLFKIVGKYPGTGGLGRAPSVSRGSALGGSRGQSPLEARAFSQSELPRKPPIDTHGRYIYNTCTGGGGGGGGGSRKVWKSRNSDKSQKNGIPAICKLCIHVLHKDNSQKYHCLCITRSWKRNQ